MDCLSGWWSMETDNLVSLAGCRCNANYLNIYSCSQMNGHTIRQKNPKHFWPRKTRAKYPVTAKSFPFNTLRSWGLIIPMVKQKVLWVFWGVFLLNATISHFFSTACHTFSLSTQGQNEFQSWIMASNEIIPKWHCEIAGWEKVPLVRQLILFPHLSLICWSHTLSRRSAAALYICLRCAGWWQGVKSVVWELSDVPVCAPITSTWDTSCLSHLSFLRAADG